MDPQGNASTGLGIEADQRERSTYDLLMEQTPLAEVVLETSVEGLSIVPATIDLSSADIELGDKSDRSQLLRQSLSDVTPESWDYVLIDCPPSLNLLTVNAMVAAQSVLIPLQSEFFALEGLSQTDAIHPRSSAIGEPKPSYRGCGSDDVRQA